MPTTNLTAFRRWRRGHAFRRPLTPVPQQSVSAPPRRRIWVSSAAAVNRRLQIQIQQLMATGPLQSNRSSCPSAEIVHVAVDVLSAVELSVWRFWWGSGRCPQPPRIAVLLLWRTEGGGARLATLLFSLEKFRNSSDNWQANEIRC